MKKIINRKILILVSLLLFLPLFVGCFGTPPTNQSPTITSTPITTATVDVLYTYDVEATDPDSGDILTYSLTTSPSGMTIDSATGVISWTPTSDQIGDNNVTVKVSDGNLFDTQSFIITVNLSCVADKPTVVTNDASNIGQTTATANGNITATGGENCTVRGFQYGLSQTPTWNVHRSGSFGTGSYNMSLSGLTCETTYYIRAYATNCAGTSYGEWKSFTTAACPPPCVADKPTIVTNDVSNIGQTTATANGNITATGGENCTVRGFQYGLTQTATWDVHRSGSFGTGSYNMSLSRLTCGTPYYVRAYATNCAGTTYGAWESFTTTDCTPNLKLTPSSQSVTVGNQATINVVVEKVTDLRGASIILNFDASKLQYASSDDGDFIPNDTLQEKNIDNTNGSVTLDIAGLGTSGYHSGMDTGTIMTVKFDTIATANPTNITFGTTQLRDKDNNPITHTKGSGCSVTIN